MHHSSFAQDKLSATTLASLRGADVPVAIPDYDRGRLKAGIAHIGVGNFHRAHQALYIDRCLHLPDHEGWAICGIGLGDHPAARKKTSAFEEQDGLYSVTEFAADGSSSSRLIGAMIEYLHAPSDPEAVIERLADPAIRIVSLTITEGGYNIDEASGDFMLDTPDVAADIAGDIPRTVFGFIVRALALRKRRGLPAFTVLSCDNLRSNGDTTRRAILAFARAVDPELAEWIATEVAFPNSMVDRIAPTVSTADRRRLRAATGLPDLVPVMAEEYAQWVLEDRFSSGRPDFAAVGVKLSNDVDLYEAMKGRMLNASHMLLAYPAILMGYRLVAEAMHDPLVVRLLREFMEDDVIPSLSAPGGVSLHKYKNQVLARFANPAVADQLLRVAHDGAAKIPVFHAKTITTLVRKQGNVQRAAFLLACYAKYLSGVDEHGTAFEVAEPHLKDADWSMLRSDDPLAVLKISPFHGMSLAQDEMFTTAFHAVSRSLDSDGVRQTMQMLLT